MDYDIKDMNMNNEVAVVVYLVVVVFEGFTGCSSENHAHGFWEAVASGQRHVGFAT